MRWCSVVIMHAVEWHPASMIIRIGDETRENEKEEGRKRERGKEQGRENSSEIFA